MAKRDGHCEPASALRYVPVTRRSFLKLTAGATLQFAFLNTVWGEGCETPSVMLFDKGEWRAIVCCSAPKNSPVRTAAELLVQYCQRVTGVAISLEEKPQKGTACIQIGSDEQVPSRGELISSVSGDGFVIDFPDVQSILIQGATEWGTEFGVYDFLERYLGIRWLFPGPEGEYVPQSQTLAVPMIPVRQQPLFFSRWCSGLRGKMQQTWLRRQRQHLHLDFHHNLFRLFPPEQYTKTHPHFFPVLNGERYLPAENKTQGWQPCFSAPDLVAEAVKNICQYFAEHPEATSYSLGVNDGKGYCECHLCGGPEGVRKNFIGFRDSSDVYFTWANAVVARVLQRYPDKWFGCLAYREVAQPPKDGTVHTRIVPFLTYDRLKWSDPTIRTQGQRISDRWQRASTQFGWYDYIYGTPYCVPRVYFHTMADYYRYGAAHGVRAMYAEAYPNWGEGPKLYIAIKLQWDPTLDVDALLREWCEKAVGVDAAGDLLAYYQLWEHFWTVIMPQSPWFTMQPREYLPFTRPEYLGLITDQVWKSQRLLDAVVAKARLPEQRARAVLLSQAFSYYEASALSYIGLKHGGARSMTGCQTDAIETTQGQDSYESLAGKRRVLIDKFQSHPVLLHPLRFEGYETLRW
ncbi:MAG: DUF4838 domain-containing protein [Candidatus Binatia bacterium]